MALHYLFFLCKRPSWISCFLPFVIVIFSPAAFACSGSGADNDVVTIESLPLQNAFVYKMQSEKEKSKAGAYSIAGEAYGLKIDPDSGVITVENGRYLSAVNGLYKRLLIKHGASCFSLGLNIKAKDIARWQQQDAFFVADYRRGEFVQGKKFFASEADFRGALHGDFQRPSPALALNAGRDTFKFAAGVPAITDRGLLLEDKREQFIHSPDRPEKQSIKLAPGTYTLQMWGRGNVAVEGVHASIARENAPVRFSLDKSTSITLDPAGPSKGIPAVRKFQLVDGATPTAWMAENVRAADVYELGLDTAKVDSLSVLIDMDMPPLGAEQSFLLSDKENKNGIAVRISADGKLFVDSFKAGARVESLSAGSAPSDRGSRFVLSLFPGHKETGYLFVDGRIVTRLSIDSANLKSLVRLQLGQHASADGRSARGLNGYIKKIVALPGVTAAKAQKLFGSAEEWALPNTHKPLAELKPVDPLVLDLEKMDADAVFPIIDPKTGEFSSRLSWTQNYPTPERDVVVIGARTKIRSVLNPLGPRGNEDLGRGPAKDSQRVDTDTVKTIGVVWEIGGEKTTRSVAHSATSVLRAGIHRRMNPLPGFPVSWEWATRNDPHQSRLAWNVRSLVSEPYDYYVDLLTEDVQGTVEGYHGDAGMQWQPWTTDGSKSLIGGIAMYCGHYNVEWSTYYSGFFLPVQYVSKDKALNESGPLPTWLRLERVHGRMLAEYRIYEHPETKDAAILSSPGNVTSAFFQLDLEHNNQQGSFRPYPVALKDFYVTPFPGRSLIDHVRPINGKPRRQFIDRERRQLVAVDGDSERDGKVRFPPETLIQGEIKSGDPEKPFADADQEYGPGAWYWPRFEGMLY